MSMTIDCGTCTRQYTPTCDNCVVTFILNRSRNRTLNGTRNRESKEAVVIDVAEFSALKRLQSAGMVPELLHEEADPGRPAQRIGFG